MLRARQPSSEGKREDFGTEVAGSCKSRGRAMRFSSFRMRQMKAIMMKEGAGMGCEQL